MLEAGSTFAGTPGSSAPSDKEVLTTPVVSPVIKGPLIIGITVVDDSNDPIEGAEVTAPCTGLPPAYTNAEGYASFSVSTCNCGDKPAHISTAQGCDVNISLVCGTGNKATCTNQD